MFTDADIIASTDLLSRHLRGITAERAAIAVVGMELQVESLEEYERLREHAERAPPAAPDRRARSSRGSTS